MKHVLTAILITLVAAPAMAVLSLPIADDATSRAGELSLSGGVTLESDLNLYGARLSYGISDQLSLFGGIGLADPDDLDSEPYFQIGGKFVLPVQLPFELALRAGFGMVSFEENEWGTKWELDVWMLSGGLLGSMAIDEMITVYGFGGLSYQKTEISISGWGSNDDTETELALAGGILFSLNQNLSFYGELAHIDDLYISAGARFDF